MLEDSRSLGRTKDIALGTGCEGTSGFSGSILFFFFFFGFLGPCLLHMDILRLGGELELQLPAYTTATATQNPSCVCDIHHSSPQHQISNPLSEGRDRTWVLTDPSSLALTHWATTGTPHSISCLGWWYIYFVIIH